MRFLCIEACFKRQSISITNFSPNTLAALTLEVAGVRHTCSMYSTHLQLILALCPEKQKKDVVV